MIEITKIAAVNYEIIRDFCGSVFTDLNNKIEGGTQVTDKELWEVLALYVLPSAVIDFCHDYTYCHSDEELRREDSFFNRYKIITGKMCDEIDFELGYKMVEALTTNDYSEELIEEVFRTLVMDYNFGIYTIVNQILYTDKFLAYREYANLKNSKMARKILARGFMSNPTKWNGSHTFKGSMWLDLE